MDIEYKDLDHIGPYTVAEVERALAETYDVPEVMNRTQYIHFADRVGLHRVLHGRPNEIIHRDKLAREVTRHLNYHMIKGDLPPEPEDTEETDGKVWM